MDGKWSKWWLLLLAPCAAVAWCIEKLRPTPFAPNAERESDECK